MKRKFFFIGFLFLVAGNFLFAQDASTRISEAKMIEKLDEIRRSVLSGNRNWEDELKKIIDAYEKEDLNKKNSFYGWLYANGLFLESQFVKLWYRGDKIEERGAFQKYVLKLNDKIDPYYAKMKFRVGDKVDSHIMTLYAKNYLYIFLINKTFINFGLQMDGVEFLLKYAIFHNSKNSEAKLYLALFYMEAGNIRYRTMGMVSRFFVTSKSILKSTLKEDPSEENRFRVHFLYAFYYYYLGYKKEALEEASLAKAIYPNSRYNAIIESLIHQTMGDAKPIFPLMEGPSIRKSEKN